MPVYNTSRYLRDALNSIGAQSFTDIEFIAIDDGSDDGSAAILEQFATRESRMRLVKRGNLGLIATRNELLEAARGELVAWMDSDDISLPHRLALQIEAFERDPELACLGTAAQCIDPDGNYLNLERYPSSHPQILIEQQKGGAMRFPTTMMRRDLALRVGGFREPFRIGEDFDLLLRLSEIGKMANLPDTLYLYRQHISSVCATLGPQWPIYRDHILELARERRNGGRDRLQNGGSISIPKATSMDTKQNEWRAYLSWADHALRNRNFPLSWNYARAALARRPLSRAAWKMLLRILRRAGPGMLISKMR
jgi:glycosyltransferase involved in cell wall biosynthesis